MSGTEPRLVSLEEIREAYGRIAGAVRRTPLLPAPLPATDGGPSIDRPDRIWLKCENLQWISAFKARGAQHFVSRLTDEERARGLVTYSSGNHAQAVAFASRAFGVPATIVMPTDAPRVKLEATKRLGAAVELAGTTSAERKERAERLVAERGGTMVPPFDHRDIVAGQGTVGLEIVDELAAAGGGSADGGGPGDPPRPALVLAPIGGGGLVSGVAAAVRGLCPEARVVGVEPSGAASMRRSLEAGSPVVLERVETIADGLKPVRPGDLTFAHCRTLVDDVVTVEDDEIRAATLWLFRRRLVVEPSGAATVAALLAGRIAPPPGEEGATVAILSGGNIEPALLAEWLDA